ncbi:hypothetical protein ABTY20_25240 [Streptomyces sp. NPDC126497]|uniref:hypothetical protein n=1 Tax=Streptomyces sp. NPDC126497 TaxID=3155313 RepID=UPI0033272DC3
MTVLDDMLPGNVDEAARDGHTGMRAGDVFKVLRRFRPRSGGGARHQAHQCRGGLRADPTSTVVKDDYDRIIKKYRADDPQVVPEGVLPRKNAVRSEAPLGAGF